MIMYGMSIEYSRDGKTVVIDDGPDKVTVRPVGRSTPCYQFALPAEQNGFYDLTILLNLAWHSGQYSVRTAVKEVLGL